MLFGQTFLALRFDEANNVYSSSSYNDNDIYFASAEPKTHLKKIPIAKKYNRYEMSRYDDLFASVKRSKTLLWLLPYTVQPRIRLAWACLSFKWWYIKSHVS